mmetsp:Transcript_20057/g.56858  ORF Transcript_20057/g.56858 Transcript_20057/m.56858 type:complete len:210 (-) Transcript_20057:607-1236(-)
MLIPRREAKIQILHDGGRSAISVFLGTADVGIGAQSALFDAVQFESEILGSLLLDVVELLGGDAGIVVVIVLIVPVFGVVFIIVIIEAFRLVGVVQHVHQLLGDANLFVGLVPFRQAFPGLDAVDDVGDDLGQLRSAADDVDVGVGIYLDDVVGQILPTGVKDEIPPFAVVQQQMVLQKEHKQVLRPHHPDQIDATGMLLRADDGQGRG